MPHVTTALPTLDQSLQPTWDAEHLTNAFRQSLGRLYASFVLLAVMTAGAVAYALIGLLSH